MKSTSRILFIFVICALLAACTPQATATPVPATTLAPTASSTPSPTATPTHTPEPSPTPLPAYVDWMESHVEGLMATQEGDVFYLVQELADGQQIKVFEYVNNEWQPSYVDMGKFVREDKTFDLEAAMQTMFMRMGAVADVDGQPAMSVNMEDYQRFVEKAQAIWNGLSGLKPANFNSRSGGTRVDLAAGSAFELSLQDGISQWQLIGWAKNPTGPESVFVIATSDGPVALLNVGEVGYTHLNNKDSIEEVVIELANQTSTQFGDSDVVMLLLDPTPNSRFNGTVNADKVALMRAYIRGMKIDAAAIRSMMFGDLSAHRAALKFMFEHFPAPIEDISGDR
jgi:hypothetical protein